MAEALRATGADGVFGDAAEGPGQGLLAAAGKPEPVFEPERGAGIHELAGLSMTRAFWETYPPVPGVDRYRWAEPRLTTHLALRDALSHEDELQFAWLNGDGIFLRERNGADSRALSPRDAEALRRMAMIYRAVPEFPRSPGWEPHAATLGPPDVFASRWPLPFSGTLWTFVNRGGRDLDGPLLEVSYRAQRFYDLWTGAELHPDEKLINRLAHRAVLRVPLEAHGYGAVLETNEPPVRGSRLARLLEAMRSRPRSVRALPPERAPGATRLVSLAATARHVNPPEGMVRIPGAKGWRFSVTGVSLGADARYPWESTNRRDHDTARDVAPFDIDRLPVTNRQYKKYLDERDYEPADPHGFLRDWPGGHLPPGLADKPVTWVSIEEARAYCRDHGKRLPHEWEWQLAAEGPSPRAYPWGSAWDAGRVPPPSLGRVRRPGPDVGGYPEGASPYGVLDLTGLVWQWTDEIYDGRLRAAVLKGGSLYQPSGSPFYFPTTLEEGRSPELRGRYKASEHEVYLLMDPSLDRAGTIGFRCAADAPVVYSE
jgi:formylglycine-generating enzyme required for sulfatase activity